MGFRGKNKVFTRRKLMQQATAAGISGLCATALTADDVRGADSDQVPISMDAGGTWIKYVPKDWFERVQNAKTAKNTLAEEFMAEDEVLEVVYSSGNHGGENPHVIITLDEDSENKDQLRGEIPERENDTPVRIREGAFFHEDPCDICDTECDERILSNPDTLPGGYRVRFSGQNGDYVGTLTSLTKHNNYYNYGWSTSAHIVSSAFEGCGADLIGKNAYHNDTYIGSVNYINHDTDFAFIAADGSVDPWESNLFDYDPDRSSFVVHDTLTDEGIDEHIANEGDYDYLVRKTGIASCQTNGFVKSRGRRTIDKTDRDPCKNYYENQIGWGVACEDNGDGGDPGIDCGDSGSLTWTTHPDDPYFYAVCINHRFTVSNRIAGTSGPKLRQQEGFWWEEYN